MNDKKIELVCTEDIRDICAVAFQVSMGQDHNALLSVRERFESMLETAKSEIAKIAGRSAVAGEVIYAEAVIARKQAEWHMGSFRVAGRKHPMTLLQCMKDRGLNGRFTAGALLECMSLEPGANCYVDDIYLVRED